MPAHGFDAAHDLGKPIDRAGRIVLAIRSLQLLDDHDA